jgi:alkylhydroperoxidase family enzyme
MALAAGVGPDKVAAVRSGGDDASFDETERAVLAFTDALCEGTVGEEPWTALAARFEPRELVELVLTGASYVMVARVLDALAVPIEGS